MPTIIRSYRGIRLRDAQQDQASEECLTMVAEKPSIIIE